MIDDDTDDNDLLTKAVGDKVCRALAYAIDISQLP